MKKYFSFLIVGLMFTACTTQPVAMKSNSKYFTPVRLTAQAKLSNGVNRNKFTSNVLIEKELAEKNTVIDLLKKENQDLRARVAKLEKRLAITNS